MARRIAGQPHHERRVSRPRFVPISRVFQVEHWEYEVSEVITQDYARVNESLRLRSKEGWELVNGSVCSYSTGGGGGNWIVHVTYTMFWRRPLEEGDH
jgi:hypothetical protein